MVNVFNKEYIKKEGLYVPGNMTPLPVGPFNGSSGNMDEFARQDHQHQLDLSDNAVSGFRNKIINPQGVIRQRGVGAFTTYGTYTLDQWVLDGNGGTGSIAASAAPPGAYIEFEVDRSFMGNTVNGGSAAGNYNRILNKVEDVITLAGKTCTLSFVAMGATGGPFYIGLEAEQFFGSGGSLPVLGIINKKIQVRSDLPVRYSVTFDMPSISGKTLGAGHHTMIDFWFSDAGTYNNRNGGMPVQSSNFVITQVQLELGDKATKFEQRPVGIELALCQRYFIKFPAAIGGSSAAGVVPHLGWGVKTVHASPNDSGVLSIYTPVGMRTLPTLATTGQSSVWSGVGGGFQTNLVTITQPNTVVNDPASGKFWFDITFAQQIGLGTGMPLMVYTSPSGTFGLSAEL